MSAFNPLVSIVIPVYNGENFLHQAIDSAIEQTYKHIEILVVNDGSHDNGTTRDIALSYGNRIRYFEKRNGGCASALNFGISQMKGEYFSWLSHDDKYLPEKIEHQVSLLRGLENKRTIIYGGYQVIDKESRPLYRVCPDHLLPANKLNIPLFPLMRGLIHGCSLLIPAALFKEVSLFDESLPSTQDYALWFDFLRVCPIRFQDRQLVMSRVHPDQGTHKIKGHNEECNALWSGFLHRLTEDEMVEMEGSKYRFLNKTAEFLETTPYKDAANLSRNMMAKALSQILVSVVVPFHNRTDWTIEAIRSVQEQSHQNFELLLIDDGSTDNLAFMLEYIESDHRIKYYRQDNAGPASARNWGIELAVGRYIAFLDSDDTIHPEKLATQIKYMEENRYVLSHTSYHRMDLNGKVLSKVSSGKFSGKVLPQIITSCPIAMPTVMALTSVLKDCKFPENISIGEDVCLWISLSMKLDWGGIDVPLSFVRVGPETAAFNRNKQIIGLIGIAYFVARDPLLCCHERELKVLLSNASLILRDDNEVATNYKKNEIDIRKTGLLSKIVFSIRRDGLRATLNRIRYRLGI